MGPCPDCTSPAVIAAIDQLKAAICDLEPEPDKAVTLQRAIVRLLRLVAHGTDNPPHERTSQ